MQAVSETFRCSECGSSDFVDRDGFRWCTACGVGQPLFEVPHRVPGVGNRTNAAPVNKLCHGRDLGNPDINTVGQKSGLLEVLKQGGRENLGIRAIQMKNECMRAQETTISQRMKSYGSALCKDAGFQQNFLLANALGSHIEWIATLLTMRNDGRHSKDLTVATFLLNVVRFCSEEKANRLMEKLWGRERAGKIVIPESKARFLGIARRLLELEELVF